MTTNRRREDELPTDPELDAVTDRDEQATHTELDAVAEEMPTETEIDAFVEETPTHTELEVLPWQEDLLETHFEPNETLHDLEVDSLLAEAAARYGKAG